MTLRLRVHVDPLLELLVRCAVRRAFVRQPSQCSLRELASLAVDQLVVLLTAAVTRLEHFWPSQLVVHLLESLEQFDLAVLVMP